jgi:hypothetical protein
MTKNKFGREPLKVEKLISGFNPNIKLRNANINYETPLNADLSLTVALNKDPNFIKKYIIRMTDIINVTLSSKLKASNLNKKLKLYKSEFPSYCQFHSNNAGDVVPIIDERFSDNEGLDVWAAVLFPVSLQIWDDMLHSV